MEVCHRLDCLRCAEQVCHCQQGLVDAGIHLCSGLAGKGEGEDFRHLQFLDADQVGVAAGQHKGLSRTRSCGGNGVDGAGDGGLLLLIQSPVVLGAVSLQKPVLQCDSLDTARLVPVK